jgi:hypothetical protein
VQFVERKMFIQTVFDRPWSAQERPTYAFSILNADSSRFDTPRIEESLVRGLVAHLKIAPLSGTFTQLAWRHIFGWTASPQNELADCLTIIRSATAHNVGTQFWSAVVAQLPFGPAELPAKLTAFEWRANKIGASLPPGTVREIDLRSDEAVQRG